MKLNEIPFLKVNEESITLQRAIGYLKTAGSYERLMADVVRQYILEQELQQRTDIQFNSLQVDQALMDFRVQSNLRDADSFQQWMQANGVNYEQFRQNIEFGFKVEQLRNEVTEPKLEDYFQEQKPFLDRVILSRMILDNRELAEHLKGKILEDRNQFEPLVQQYSLTDDRVANGMMGAVPKGQMPDILRTAIDLANPGEIVGPIEIEGRYCLFRVEQFLPAALQEVRQELQNQLFEQWLQDKLKEVTVKLNIA